MCSCGVECTPDGQRPARGVTEDGDQDAGSLAVHGCGGQVTHALWVTDTCDCDRRVTDALSDAADRRVSNRRRHN